MNLIPTNPSATMSSREIAELVESRHDDVKRSINRLASRGAISIPPTAEYLDTLGRPASEYRICKRDSYVIVAQLSPEFTARLVDRWQELEAQVSGTVPQVPQTYSQALRLAAEQAEQIEAQTKLIEQQRPAVEFAHAVRNTKDAITVADMAKILGTGQKRLFRRLRDDGLLMENNRPYQIYIDRGYFRVIETVWIDSAKEAHPNIKTLVTGKGQVYLQNKYGVPAEECTQ